MKIPPTLLFNIMFLVYINILKKTNNYLLEPIFNNSMKLPFEEIKRKTIVKNKSKTNDKYGKKPEQRTTEEIINYGVINIDKPSGPSSHQVSGYLQKILNIKKAGHSGTLDPHVTGVLPIALGRATRVVEYLLKAGKEYVGIMHLHKKVDEKEIKKAFKEFTGKIKQLPPIKSSVKRQERTREIYYLKILEIDKQDVLFKVGCQAGTYIRKLCLHPNTEIISKDSIILAKDFFDNPKIVHSMNNKKIQLKHPSETQKFKFSGKLIKVTMSSGIDFIVTPDHRMLISSEKGYIMKEASKLKDSDYIVKSLTYNFREKKPVIPDLLDDSYLVDQKNIKEAVKKTFIKKYGSIRAMNRKLKLDRKSFLKNSKVAIPISHIKKAGIYEEVKKKIYSFKTEKGIEVKLSELSNDLMYLIGLIASDGNNTKEKGTKRHTRIKFHNKNNELIGIFLKKYNRIFPNFNLTQRRRNDNVIELDTSNSFFATICANLGIKSPQKDSDILPILYFNKEVIVSFLRGYFDGDGTAYYKNKKNIKGTYTRIDLFSVDKTNAKRIHQMLSKLDISSAIFKKKTCYVVSINDPAAKKKFISLIGSNHPLKKEKLKMIDQTKSSEIKDNLYVGLHYKEEIRKNKSKLYKMGGNLSRVLNSSIPITKGFYRKANRLVKLPVLDKFCIEKIKSIESITYKGNVFDMTVPDTHNFLIETGFVSSNCHNIGQRLGTGAHMAELRRTKAGPFDESTLFTLQDVADAMHYYKKGDDTFIRKIIQPVESAIKHLPKVYVIDSAINSICYGINLKAPGISKFESNINIDDDVAILTLKNELIAIGKACFDSETIKKLEKGIVIKVNKVFMKPNTYPRN
jgi:predicted RNA-binding protein (TIGR00451 family)